MKTYRLLLVLLLFTNSLYAQQWNSNGNNYSLGKLWLGTNNGSGVLSINGSGNHLELKGSNITTRFIGVNSSDKFYISNWADPSKGIVLLNNGNVGIGTNTPNTRLHLFGDKELGQLTVHTSSGSLNKIAGLNLKVDNVDLWQVYTDNKDGNNFHIKHNNTFKYLTIKPNGNVGFSYTNPSTKVHIYDDNILGQLTLHTSSISTNRRVGLNLRVDNIDLWQVYNDNADGNKFIIQHGQENKKFFAIDPTGSIGIGTTNTRGFKLAVKGKIGTEEIQVHAPGYWPDYVFSTDYNLKPLSEVESFIEQNNHLPDIPSEKEVKEKGINIGVMNAKLLQKIEELTLYMIEQNKETKALRNENKALKKRIEALEEK